MIKKYCIFPMTLLSAVLGLSSCYGNTSNDTLTEATNPVSEAEKTASLQRHSYELGIIDVLIEQYHYKDYQLNNAFSRKILESYLKQLDPNRLYFTKSDIVEFNKHRDKFDDDIKTGNLEPALSIFNTYQQRVKERSDFAAKRISEAFDFVKNEDYRLDRSKSNWAENVYVLNDLWRKRIKNDLINQRLAQKDDESIATLKKRYENLSKRTSQITSNETFQIIANAYAAALEPHTSYFSPRASEEFNIQMRLSLDGIGAVLRTDKEHTQIVNVVPGGPADLTGNVKAGDRIIAIGQGEKGKMIDVVGWRLSDVVNIIRGQKGSTVVLSVLPSTTGLSGKSKKVSIVRDKIKLEYQAAKKRIIDVKTKLGQSKIGIIDLPSFYIDFEARSKGDKNYRSTTRDVTRLINELKADKIDGLVIDLRGNGGGSLSEVISLTGLFIDHGTVVQVNDSKGVISRHNDNDRGVTYNGPLAVMIDRGSASASEIFAGAIKDYKRGVILGETTFGKGTVQTILPLNAYSREQFSKPLGQIKITTAQFFRVNGESTQFHGVKPDISWPVPKPKDEFGERSLDNALPWKKIAKVNYPLYSMPFSPTAISHEDKLSKARIINSKKFQITIRKMQLLISAGNKKILSLNLATRKNERELFNKKLLQIENQLRMLNNKSAFKTIADLQSDQEKRNDDIFNTTKRPADVFLVESANILNDLRIMNKKPTHVANQY